MPFVNHGRQRAGLFDIVNRLSGIACTYPAMGKDKAMAISVIDPMWHLFGVDGMNDGTQANIHDDWRDLLDVEYNPRHVPAIPLAVLRSVYSGAVYVCSHNFQDADIKIEWEWHPADCTI